MARETVDLPPHVLRPLRVGFGVITTLLGAFLIWAIWAPLATSIPTTGHLNTNRPSYDVQHGFGGEIARIHVQEHASVEQGALLITLDVTREQAERDALDAARRPLVEERAAIRAALAGQLPEADDVFGSANAAQMAVRRMQNMQTALQLRVEMSAALKTALEARAAFLAESIARRAAQHGSMTARKARYAGLRAEGAFRAADIDALSEDILELESALARDRAELSSLQNQAQQTEMQVARETLEHRQQLLDRMARIEESLPPLQRQILRLTAQIEQAEIRAPEAGIVAALYYDTTAMVIPRGETVLTLARPSERHQISFRADPQVIDQLRIGMTGQLTVTALPQRSHPRVTATLTSLSPEARRDADGAVLGYDGVAHINPEDHAALLASLGEEATLATDMPVSLVFVGPNTTFGAYLMGPIGEFLDKALQD
jgi:HlyD family type I secretion membrane fusion protein